MIYQEVHALNEMEGGFPKPPLQYINFLWGVWKRALLPFLRRVAFQSPRFNM